MPGSLMFKSPLHFSICNWILFLRGLFQSHDHAFLIGKLNNFINSYPSSELPVSVRVSGLDKSNDSALQVFVVTCLYSTPFDSPTPA